MPKTETTSQTAKQAEPQGFAQVQDPNGPDVLGANNTGRVGDAREYPAPVAAAVTEGYAVRNVAPETRYADLNGQPVSGTPGDGFRGSVIVAKGDVVNAAQAAQLNG